MKIAIGSDHAGFRYKEILKTALAARGHEVRDYGPDSDAAVDYPVFIRPVAEAVAAGQFERGIVLGPRAFVTIRLADAEIAEANGVARHVANGNARIGGEHHHLRPFHLMLPIHGIERVRRADQDPPAFDVRKVLTGHGRTGTRAGVPHRRREEQEAREPGTPCGSPKRAPTRSHFAAGVSQPRAL